MICVRHALLCGHVQTGLDSRLRGNERKVAMPLVPLVPADAGTQALPEKKRTENGPLF